MRTVIRFDEASQPFLEVPFEEPSGNQRFEKRFAKESERMSFPRRDVTSCYQAWIHCRFSVYLAHRHGITALFPYVSDVEVRFTTWKVVKALAALNIGFALHGSEVQIGANHVLMVSDCTPLMPILVLMAAILAFPTRLSWKATGMALGIPALIAFNLFRILVVIAASIHAPKWAEAIHVHLFQTFTMVVTCGMFASSLYFQRVISRR